MVFVGFLGYESVTFCQSSIAYFLNGLSLSFRTDTVVSNSVSVVFREKQKQYLLVF